MELSKVKNIYFLGIGGIGMSALARYFSERGATISGYDRTETVLTKELVAEGMQIHYEDRPDLIPQETELVILTAAIPKDQQEYIEVKRRNLPLLLRAEVLGMLSKEYKCLAVAGTHGKTTTTTLLTHLLRVGGVDCSAFLGGIAENYKSNYLNGHAQEVVVEADEFNRSFLELFPEQLIVTALDADHLDIYGTHEEMLATYAKLTSQIKSGGYLLNRHDLWVGQDLPLAGGVQRETYGVEAGIHRASNLRVENGFFVFDYLSSNGNILGLRMAMPGKHNIENATAAITIARRCGASDEAVREALGSFKGIKRRFEFVLRNEKHTIIDDYAHHPEEVRAAVRAARTLFPDKKITGLFQPHLFTRTRDFHVGFAEALSELDEVLLLEIYPARELPISGITSEIIYDLITCKNKKLVTRENFLSYVQPDNTEVFMTIGAADLDKEHAKLIERLAD